MKDEEQRCPSCGHEVLSWDVTCPGCDQVPWETAAGRRVVRGRRQRHFWLTAGPLMALVALGAVMVVIGNIHLRRSVQSAQDAGELERILERAAWLSVMLDDVTPGTPAYEELQHVTQQWLIEELPVLLTRIQDEGISGISRAAAVVSVGRLFGASSQFAQIAADYRQEAIDALGLLAEGSDETLRGAALRALAEMGVRGTAPWEARHWE